MLEDSPNTKDKLIKEYLHLSKEVMPMLALSSHKHWPVKFDHCFQRIVLDNICGGVWYDHIKRPAYRYMNPSQAELAVNLCNRIINNNEDLHVLNAKSLAWRNKQIKLDI